MNNSSAMGARTLASKVFAVLMSVILVLGLSPVTKVSYASTASDATAQASAESIDSEGNGKAVASDDDADAAGKAASAASDASAAADAAAGTDAKSAAENSSAAADAKTSADAANANAASAASSNNQASTAASGPNNSTEPASNQEGIALASASDSVEPGKYGSYAYEQNSTKNAFESSEYDAYRDSVATNLLGVAGSFHITAFNKATTSSHIYGNILTKELVGSNNFGLDSRYNEKYGYQGLSYVQNYTTPSGQPDGHEEGTFVIGSNNTVTTVDNGNHLAINGVQLDKPKTLIQDTDTANNPFIDLDAVKAYTIGVSDKLAAQGDVGASITTEGGKTYINYEGDSGCAYVTMTAKQLNEMDELYVKGMELNGKCSVVINVDMDGATELNLSKVHVLLPDGQTAGTGETDSTVGYVMFNIKNSTSDMAINLSDRVLASVLAPNSTINLGGSAAGTYIATNVNVTAESHARPFRGVFKPVTTSAKVTKQWLNAYGSTETRVEHNAVKVQLYQSKNDGEWAKYGDEVELSNANSWSYDWGSSLPKKDTDGNTYEYKVVEVSTTADYNATVTNSDDGWTITNRHVAVGKLSVSKAWKDAAGNDESGEHSAVTVKVMRSVNGTDFEQYGDSIQLSKDNNWSATVDQLPLKDADGKEYTYKVEEDVPDGYAASYSDVMTPTVDADGNKSWTYTITNTSTATNEYTDASVTKEWLNAAGVAESADEANAHGAVKAQLYQSKNGGETTAYGDAVTLSKENGWSAKWDKLLKTDIYGNTYTYTVKEADAPSDYASAVTSEGNAFKITNKKIATVTVAATKAWSDNDDVDKLRPAQITATVNRVAADGTAVAAGTIVLSAENGWKAQLGGLPMKDAAGNAYAYALAEGEVAGYTGTVSEPVKSTDAAGNSVWSFALENTHVQDTTSVKVTKDWSDSNNQDGIRPASVSVDVLQSANGKTETVRTLELSAENGWTATADGLPVNGADGAYAYSISEAKVEGYASSFAPEQTADGTWSFKLTNTHETEKTSVRVTKDWSDAYGNAEDASAHAPITAQLYTVATVDGQEVLTAVEGKTAELSNGNDWSASWEDLPAKSSGETINYTVREVGVPSDYSDSYSSKVGEDGSYVFTMNNRHVAVGKLSVSKAWKDAAGNDESGEHSSVIVRVVRSTNGTDFEQYGDGIHLGKDNNWSATVDQLPLKDADGKEYTYKVEEDVPDGYAASYSDVMTPTVDADGNKSWTYTITNQKNIISVKVTKVWDDSDNKDLLRTSSVTAQLYTMADDGTLTAVEGKTAVLNDSNNWSASWENLPVNKDGKEIKYTVRETEVPNGYTVTYPGVDNKDGSYTFTMTNTHKVVEGDFTLSGYSMQAAAAPVPEAEKVCYVDPKVVKVLDGRALKAGEFSFQLIDDETGEVKSTASNDVSGMVDFDAANPQTPDGMEPCCLTFTAKGTYSYTVREDPSQVKDGTVEYSAEVVKFIVKIDEVDGALVEAESYYLKYDSAADAAAETQATKYASTDHPTITNSAKPLSLSLTKTSSETGEALEGAVYGLYKVDENAPEGEVKVMAATSNANGVMAFSGTDADSITTDTQYFFREISAPAGYTVSENKTQTFTVQQTSEGYQLAYADGTTSKAAAGTSSDPVVYKAGEGVSDSKASITFGKVASDGTALSGAKLAVRDANGKDVDVWETDATGHVINDLVIGDAYVLYEKQAPEGYQTATEVTFKVDEYGKVAIISGASSNDVMNAYATGSTLNLVDYKKTELVEKKETVREEGVTTKKSALAKTSDQTPFIPIAALTLGAIVVAAVAYRRTKRS